MIYEYPPADAPIRQGDIFIGVPRIDLSLQELAVAGEDNHFHRMSWDDIASEGKPAAIIAAVRPVAAIVATQDCDAMRAADITLCEIRPFADVYPACRETKSPKKWTNIITQHARSTVKWFYLPPDKTTGFSEKMAADFMTTIRVARVDLEIMRPRRRARLNAEADEHFRERLSEFFRRYPYDEWYPLTAEEFAEYRTNYSSAEPRPWQANVSSMPRP